MEHSQVLETEYKEQWNQYRWIGQMQSVVLTFYGAVATFSLLALNALRTQPTETLNRRWLSSVLVAIGILGFFTGLALLRSRMMQRRTAWYLNRLLVQMTDGMTVNESALRYRALVTSPKLFALLDTMNTAFLTALVSGEALFICGVTVFLVSEFSLPSGPTSVKAAIAFLIVTVLTLILARYLASHETKNMEIEYCQASNAASLNPMSKKLGLPNCPP